MKKLLSCSIIALSVLASAGVSQAADLISPDPYIPLQAPNFSWTGFYAGAQGGYYHANVEGIAGSQASGSLGGYAGYNYQFANQFVLGAEADYNAAFGTYGGFGYELSSFGSLRARLGYAMDRTLIYATGGLGIMDFKNNGGGGNPGVEYGFAIGAGAEYMFTDNISVKAEYLYMNFQDTFEDVGAPAGVSTDIHNLRIGAAYHF